MNQIKILLPVALLFCLLGFKADKNKPTSDIGKKINSFSLRNVDNTIVSLADFSNAKGFVIVFTCNHCPFAKLYSDRLNALNDKYKSVGVPLIAINSMDTVLYEEESFELMQEKAVADKFSFPYLHDANQAVGKNFNAGHTPQSYIIWKVDNEWVIKYSGPIDNNGEHPQTAIPYLANAINDLLQNKPIPRPEMPSVGCRIFYRK
jgi:peroxiredoxin